MWRSLKCSHSRTHIRVPKQFIDPLSVNFNLKNSNEIKCESFVKCVDSNFNLKQKIANGVIVDAVHIHHSRD